MTMTNDAVTVTATKAPVTKATIKTNRAQLKTNAKAAIAAQALKAKATKANKAKATPAKAAKGKATVAKVAKMLYRPEQRIVVITKENPRRDGKEPAKRYNILTACKTVGEFLAKLPKWQATITRNVNEGHVKLVG
jgi:hypothetical protein